MENFTGAELWHFQVSDCGAEDWFEVIAADEYVPDGGTVSTYDLLPGCYDLYVEDEYACFGQTSTRGVIEGGLEFVWTVTPSDLACP